MDQKFTPPLETWICDRFRRDWIEFEFAYLILNHTSSITRPSHGVPGRKFTINCGNDRSAHRIRSGFSLVCSLGTGRGPHAAGVSARHHIAHVAYW